MEMYEIFSYERMIKLADKKRKEKSKSTLSSMQAVSYQREFKMADRAGGYTERRSRQ